MLKIYLRIALRNFWKERVNGLVNLIGLTIAITFVMLIFTYSVYQFSYDKSYSNHNDDYRVLLSDDQKESIYVPLSLGKEITTTFPEIAAYTNCQKSKQQFTIGEETYELPVLMTDSNFFKVFDLEFKYGDPITALKGINSIVIDESSADLYFPGINPVGKTLVDRGGTNPVNILVTGVIKDIPTNTHFKVKALTSALNEDPIMPVEWGYFAGRSEYLRLKKNVNAGLLQEKVNKYYRSRQMPKNYELHLQSVHDIHLKTKAHNDQFINGRLSEVNTLMAIGLLVLVVACINYVNLFTASSLKRVMEVGVRKVLGAGKRQLAFQFLRESTLFFLLVIPFAVLSSLIIWPLFMSKLGYVNNIPPILTIGNLLFLLILTLTTGLISGMYPAIYISGMSPVILMQKAFKRGNLNLGIRKLLIVLQFMMSCFMIVCTTFVLKQLKLINNIDLGFNQENLVMLPIQRYDKGEGFLKDLKSYPAIKSFAVSDFNLGEYYSNTPKIKDPSDTTVSYDFAIINADIDFINTFDIKLDQGRLFSNTHTIDFINIDSLAKDLKSKGEEVPMEQLLNSRPLILTTKAVNTLKLKKPLGKTINYDSNVRGTIVGVIKDIKGLSIHTESPLIAIRSKSSHNYYGYLYLRIGGGKTRETLEYLQTEWKKYFPGSRFSVEFGDEKLQRLYDTEYRQAGLFSIISFFAIAIASSGLFSLVSLILQQRIKEIGLRRILGSSIIGIVALVSGEFMILILISVVIAIPVSWVVTNKWLENFAYRTSLNWWVFAIGAFAVTIIGLVTVSAQSVVTASDKPVDNLKN